MTNQLYMNIVYILLRSHTLITVPNKIKHMSCLYNFLLCSYITIHKKIILDLMDLSLFKRITRYFFKINFIKKFQIRNEIYKQFTLHLVTFQIEISPKLLDF